MELTIFSMEHINERLYRFPMTFPDYQSFNRFVCQTLPPIKTGGYYKIRYGITSDTFQYRGRLDYKTPDPLLVQHELIAVLNLMLRERELSSEEYNLLIEELH